MNTENNNDSGNNALTLTKRQYEVITAKLVDGQRAHKTLESIDKIIDDRTLLDIRKVMMIADMLKNYWLRNQT
jgi:hypothetical protein